MQKLSKLFKEEGIVSIIRYFYNSFEATEGVIMKTQIDRDIMDFLVEQYGKDNLLKIIGKL